ncbi:MAG: hypothetical protein J5494_08970, partial [Candidatus Methanomethylophilaceae archaeon]|nr:hypothetical protein [Candidatus Methanomethylophilaceae archaeon]
LISYAWMAVLGKAPGPEDILTACQWGFGMNGVFEPLNASPPHPICGGSVGYYFLWAMIWGFAIFYAAAGRIYSSWRKCVASVAVLLVITAILQEFFPVKLPMYCQLGPPAAMFMILGMMLSKLGAIESAESFDIRSWKIWAVLAGSAVSAAALAIIFPPGLEWQYGGAPVPILFTEAAIVFIFLMHLSALVSKIPGISNIFIFAGKHTLGTLLLHGSVATMIFAPFFDFDGISWFPKDADFASRLSVAAITVIICMCTCVIVNSFLARKTGSRNITG